tara:strand:- start:8843 stop:9103 length:261 start_codon:yes stop_codon:yes gene_type:complete
MLRYTANVCVPSPRNLLNDHRNAVARRIARLDDETISACFKEKRIDNHALLVDQVFIKPPVNGLTVGQVAEAFVLRAALAQTEDSS